MNVYMIETPIFAKLSEEGQVTLSKSKHVNSVGIVTGESRDGTCYKIQWPLSKTPSYYHKSFITIINQSTELLNNEQKPEVSDTTDDHSSN